MGVIFDTIFGGGDDAAPVERYKPYAFTTPGVSMDLRPGQEGFDFTRSPEMQRYLTGMSGEFGKSAEELRALLPEVSPAFGNLSKAALANIENQRLRTIGDLKENLARRRVGGSSFAMDAAARTDAEFGERKAEVGAQMKLAEIDATTKLIQQITDTSVNKWKTFIDQANFESGLAAQLSSGVSTAMAANAQMAAQINAQNTANTMDFVGSLAGMGMMYALLSDRRLKKNIEPVGQLPNGLTWYKFDYIWDEPSEGVMADEVEQLIPEAVSINEDGYKMVDYSRIMTWH